jgi:ATP-dependent RNA helicase RhlE
MGARCLPENLWRRLAFCQICAPDMVFEDFQLSDDVQLAVKAAGYTEPTPIQQRAIPLILEGKDVIGSAQTGTGKTAAFALPILTRLNRIGGTRALIIEPTRELALQVEAAFRAFGRFSPLKVGVMYGGVGYGKQSEQLATGMDVWVVTPGRALDYLERGALKLQDLEVVVLDEADRLLDMGFLPDVRRLLEQCPRNRQTLLFSATIPPEIDGLVKWAMRDPETVSIGIRRSPAETVTHNLYPVASAQKFDLLHALLEHTQYHSVIVFCRMKIGADQVASRLIAEGHKVAVLHSDRAQKEREESLAGFRDGRFEVLVATDIASRGLDIASVTHVINFDVPQHPEDYVHRIGRTGRAQQEGDALTIFTAEDVNHVQAIERFIERPIPRLKLETFPYFYTALFELKTGDNLEKVRVTGGRSGKGYSYSTGRKRR